MATQAQIRANQKYVAKAYDRIVLTMPKGERDAIKASAAAAGESVNAYINQAVKERQARDAAASPDNTA